MDEQERMGRMRKDFNLLMKQAEMDKKLANQLAWLTYAMWDEAMDLAKSQGQKSIGP